MSIQAQGIIQPITVRKMGGDTYQLISGERRLQASKMAGMQTIPAYVRTADDEQMLEMALIENIQRQDLNPMEIALAYHRLVEELNLRLETRRQSRQKEGYGQQLHAPAQTSTRDSNRTRGPNWYVAMHAP